MPCQWFFPLQLKNWEGAVPGKSAGEKCQEPAARSGLLVVARSPCGCPFRLFRDGFPVHDLGAGTGDLRFAEDIAQRRELLIGICLDAPRFRENCFCVGFIDGEVASSWAVDKHRFGGGCKLASVLPCDRCSPQGNGRKSRCRRPHRGTPHRCTFSRVGDRRQGIGFTPSHGRRARSTATR